ncbi:hypothetical protein PN836_009650 [Ningiella sp. W23]|uniref:hypothetical protein n=1 Tax=Ningiella sp. W23 TaxID=3023715 RepID=UPI003758224A
MQTQVLSELNTTTRLALVLLLLDVMILMPHLLSGAFNPMSVNGASLALAYVIYKTQHRQDLAK